MPDGSMALHKRMESVDSSKYTAFLVTLKYNCLKQNKITMCCDVCNTCE